MKTLPLLLSALILRSLPLVLAAGLSFNLASCSSSNEPKKKKPVTVDEFDSSSNLPWNRPRAFESGGALGRMMPQSR